MERDKTMQDRKDQKTKEVKTCVASSTSPCDVKQKQYIVHLDQDEMWKEIVHDHLDEIKDIYASLKKNNSTIQSVLHWVLSKSISLSSSLNCVKYDKEVANISKWTGIPFGDVVMLQIMYELSSLCTSFVFTDGDNQNVHVRSMDWPLKMLKDMTIQVEFQRNKKTVFHGITWAGYIGLFTAMKPGLCSLSLNYRPNNNGIFNILTSLAQGKWPSGYLIRDIMEKEVSIEKITKRLTDTHLVAPCYFVLCGIKESCRIIRDMQSFQLVKSDKGVVIQTNRDDEKDKRNILYSKERHEAAIKFIENAKKVHHTKLLPTVTEFPIINEETIYVTVMVPAKNYMEYKIV